MSGHGVNFSIERNLIRIPFFLLGSALEALFQVQLGKIKCNTCSTMLAISETIYSFFSVNIKMRWGSSAG